MLLDSERPGDVDIEDKLPEITEALVRQNLNMQHVLELAKRLVLTHPDKFSVNINGNDSFLNLNVRTAFKVIFEDETEAIPLLLSVGVTRWKDGDTTHEVNIRPEKGSEWDEERISYRLDVGRGKDTEKKYQSILELSDDIIVRLLLSTFETNKQGEHISYTDRYAQSTIEAKEAIDILENASQLHRPVQDDSPEMSLSQFQEWIKKQTPSDSMSEILKILS